MASPRRASCPICASAGAGEILLRAQGAPSVQNRRYASTEAARAATRGSLDYRRCRSCGFVWNAAFEAERLDYRDYHIDQGHSPRFVAHMQDVAQRLVARLDERAEVRLVEVGAGRGRFLSALLDQIGDRLDSACAYEPSGALEVHDPRVEVRTRFFDQAAATAHTNVQLVVSRHVIEHVPAPLAFVSALRDAVVRGGWVVLETPNLDRMYEDELFHDFCYEHCNFFDPTTLDACMRAAGLEDVSVEPCFDGEYLLGFGRRGEGSAPWAPPHALKSHTTDFEAARSRWRSRVQRLPKPLVVWGAAGKGGMFAFFVDPEAELIDAFIDIDPHKWGSFVPATGHPIHGPSAIESLEVASVLVANPSYLAETRDYCRTRRPQARVWAIEARDEAVHDA